MKFEGMDRKNIGKQMAAFVILIILAVFLGVLGFLHQREADREAGKAHGYTTGYCIGYADYLNGTQQNSLKLAGEIVPYEAGTGKWKYFIMGFDSGYSDGLSGEMVWDINAP